MPRSQYQIGFCERAGFPLPLNTAQHPAGAGNVYRLSAISLSTASGDRALVPVVRAS